MLRLTFIVSWKITSVVTGLDSLMTTVEIIIEVVRTARQRKAKVVIQPDANPPTAGK